MQDFLTSRKTPTSLDDIKSRLHLAREGPILRVQEVLRVSLLGDIFIYISVFPKTQQIAHSKEHRCGTSELSKTNASYVPRITLGSHPLHSRFKSEINAL